MKQRSQLKTVFEVLLSCTIALGVVMAILGWMTGATQAVSPGPFPGSTQAVPSPRGGHTLVNVNGEIYLFGGWILTETSAASNGPTAPASVPVNDLWRWDGDQDWEQIVPANAPPPARDYHAATASGGKMYIFGGEGPAGTYYSDTWTYSPANNTWQAEGPWAGVVRPDALSHHQMVLLRPGVMLVFGGVKDGVWGNPFMWKYDAGNCAWEKKAACPAGARSDFSMAESNGKIIIWGGTDSFGVPRNDAWAYDPQTDTWEEITPPANAQLLRQASGFPSPTTYMATAFYGNQMWILGGVTTDLVDDVWEFDFTNPTSPTVRALPDLPAPRAGAAAAVVGVRPGAASPTGTLDILIFGGESNGQWVTNTLSYAAEVPLHNIYLPLVQRDFP